MFETRLVKPSKDKHKRYVLKVKHTATLLSNRGKSKKDIQIRRKMDIKGTAMFTNATEFIIAEKDVTICFADASFCWKNYKTRDFYLHYLFFTCERDRTIK